MVLNNPLEAWPQVELVDYPAGNQFSAVAWRPEAEWSEDGNAIKATGADAEDVTPLVTPPVAQLLALLAEQGELSNSGNREHLKHKDRTHVRERYVEPALAQDLVEYTIPDKPNSRLQKYRLTAAGKALLKTRQARKE